MNGIGAIMLLGAVGLSLCAVLPVGSAPDPERPVSFSAPAMRAERLMAALSDATGVPLVCAPEMRDEVLLLRVRGAPLSEVRERLAEAAGARWEPEGQGYRLTRPPELEAVQRRLEVTRRTAEVRASLAAATAPLSKPWTPAALKLALPARRESETTGRVDRSWERLDPAVRAFMRCLRDVSPDAVAALGAGDRLLFSNLPVGRERPLGAGAREALAQLVPEQKRFGEVLKQAGVAPGFEDEVLARFRRSDDFPMGPHMPWRRLSPYTRAPARVLLSVERKWQWTYELSFTVLDAGNRQVVSLGDFTLGDDLIRTRDMSAARPAAAVARELVRLTPASRALLEFFSRRAAATPGAPPRLPPHELRALLSDPEGHEPLGLIVSDAYLTLAEDHSLNLAAALPDRLAEDALGLDASKGVRLADVLSLPNYARPMVREHRGSWLVVRPSDPYEARLERGDRRVLGVVCRRVLESGRVRIEDAAALAAASGNKPMYHFSNQYLWAISGGEYNSGGYGNWTFLALYGSLNPEQRRKLLDGGAVRFNQLDARQRALAERAVFGARYNGSWVSTGRAPRNLGELADEPFETYPAGLPADGTVRVSRRRHRLVSFLQPPARGVEDAFWSFDADEGDGPGGYSGPGIRLPKDGFSGVRYQLRLQESVEVSVTHTPWTRGSAVYVEEPGLPLAPAGALTDLPADLRARVEKEIRWVKQLGGEGR
jgi:hypothetical protein